MNSRERFLAVLNGQMPDRVPVTLFIQDQGHFLNQVYPDVDPWDFETLHLKVIEIQRQLGVDVFVRMLFGLNDPLSIHMGGLNVSQQSDHWEVHTEESRRGATAVRQSTIRTPDGVLTQEFSRSEIRPGTFVYACTKKPIQTPADLEIAIKHEPPMPESFKKNAADRGGRIKAALGDADLARVKALVAGRYAILSGIDQVNVLQLGNRPACGPFRRNEWVLENGSRGSSRAFANWAVRPSCSSNCRIGSKPASLASCACCDSTTTGL